MVSITLWPRVARGNIKKNTNPSIPLPMTHLKNLL